jgi:hypothetical protein
VTPDDPKIAAAVAEGNLRNRLLNALPRMQRDLAEPMGLLAALLDGRVITANLRAPDRRPAVAAALRVAAGRAHAMGSHLAQLAEAVEDQSQQRAVPEGSSEVKKPTT